MIKNLLLIFSLLIFSLGNVAWADNPCKADKEKFCSHCTPGDKECVNKCMTENKESFSPECKQHMQEKRKEGVRKKP